MEEETIRQGLEREELERLAPTAAKACETKGRLRSGTKESAVRTCYQRDTDRILHCKAFRRLMHKTQVFLKARGGPLPHPHDPYAGGGPPLPGRRPVGCGSMRI